MLLTVQFAGLAILLFFSAYFSASETALTSLGKMKMKSLIEKERAHHLSFWLEDSNQLLATILVGNNIVNIAASVLFTAILLRLLGPTAMNRVAALSIGIMSFLILVFGEIAPKTYARHNAEKIALKTINLLRFLSLAFSPIIKLLVFIAHIVIRLSGGRIDKHEPFMTEEEIRGVISVGEEEGVLEEEEKEMIDSIFDFGDTKVQEVMIPRPDIVAVEAGRNLADITRIAIEAGHSRVPIFEKKMDNIIGILYVKDLLSLWGKENEGQLKVKDLIRTPYFIPETKKVSELLREFKKKKIHLAIVVDEYGGIAGLVTLEDLLEEIVGEIEDEYDERREHLKLLDGGAALVDGKMDVGEVNGELDINLPEKEGVETVAGFIVDHLGRVPNVGEVITFNCLKLSIEKADRRRIIEVKIVKQDNVEENNGDVKNEKDR